MTRRPAGEPAKAPIERHRCVLAALALVLLLLGACGDDGGAIDRDGSARIDDVDEPARDDPPTAFAITYRVEEIDGDDVRVSTYELLVRRPFESRIEIDGKPSRVSAFEYLAEGTAVFTAPPQPAVSDIRGDVVFADDDAVETRRVAGRTCWVHQLGGPITGGAVTQGDTTDVCVDEDGLVLEQVVHDGDEIATRWLATGIDTSPRLTGDDFRVDGTVVDVESGGGSVQEVEASSRSIGRFFELDAPIDGFEHRGRYAVVPPQASNVDDPRTRGQVLAGVVDLWVDGLDIVIIDQGGTLGQVPAFGRDPNGERVDLGVLGDDGEVFATPFGAEVRVIVPPGRYVRVVGTLPADELVEIARSLHEVEGEGLVYLDGARAIPVPAQH